MKVFISWSGSMSKDIAEAFHEWLPSVIQAIEPWMSASDIDKGARWSSDIAVQLEETRFGLICLTTENLEAPWILFEAGALSKTLEKTFVCPYLFGLSPADLQGPLVQFQAARAEKEETRKLIHTINRALGNSALPENQVNKAFDIWWPEFEEKLKRIERPKINTEPYRDDREILEEILELVRSQTRESVIIPEQEPDKVENDISLDWRVGSRVRHEKYGTGVILRVEGKGDAAKLTVSFPGYGQKKFVSQYAGLEKA